MKSIGVIVVAVVALINFSGVRCNPIETEYEPKCDSYPVLKNEGLACRRIYKPLCGTDGFTYPNVCELCNTRLRTKTGIKIQHQEKCTIQEQCQRFEENMFCTMEYRPLCGSDNKIYSNMCAFCNGWKGNKALELISEGPCN